MVDTVSLAQSGAADLSVIGLFLQADGIVKTVLLILVLMSFWSWAIIFDKMWRLRRLRSQADEFEDQFWSGRSLDELYDRLGKQPGDPMAALFAAAMGEWRRVSTKNVAGLPSTNIAQRIDRVMQVTATREMERIERYMIFLGSVGSSAPFIGLFGTVWGIMNSFAAIAASKNTSLAVVAPGIAEALFATALGLVAAIPAVIAYNKISADLNRYANRMEAFAGEFGAILSRRLDEKAA
ncbi:MAG: protein TolQ [Dongiaceae bacterium]